MGGQWILVCFSILVNKFWGLIVEVNSEIMQKSKMTTLLFVAHYAPREGHTWFAEVQALWWAWHTEFATLFTSLNHDLSLSSLHSVFAPLPFNVLMYIYRLNMRNLKFLWQFEGTLEASNSTRPGRNNCFAINIF